MITLNTEKRTRFSQENMKGGIDDNVTLIHHPDVSAGWEQWYLLTADRHWDNPKSDHDMQRRHLELAKEVGAGIIDIGDFFCVMQGKYDRRADKKSLRPEHQVNDYFNAVVDTAVDFFAPYADRFVLIGEGNHETAITKRHEVDLNKMLIKGLNMKAGTQIRRGHYSGFVRFSFERANKGGHRQSIDMYYHHGHGGGGPVTKGVIQSNRRAAAIEADILISGHIHESWEVTNMRFGLNHNGDRVQQMEQTHLSIPTYKEEFESGKSGYHIENARPPKMIGARALRFYLDSRTNRIEYDSHLLR